MSNVGGVKKKNLKEPVSLQIIKSAKLSDMNIIYNSS